MTLRERAADLDQTYRRDPLDLAVARERKTVLEELALEELGLVFRYIPAGPFQMGSENGDSDERPFTRSSSTVLDQQVPGQLGALLRTDGLRGAPEELSA